jgi:hypothetical protein
MLMLLLLLLSAIADNVLRNMPNTHIPAHLDAPVVDVVINRLHSISV